MACVLKEGVAEDTPGIDDISGLCLCIRSLSVKHLLTLRSLAPKAVRTKGYPQNGRLAAEPLLNKTFTFHEE